MQRFCITVDPQNAIKVQTIFFSFISNVSSSLEYLTMEDFDQGALTLHPIAFALYEFTSIIRFLHG
jgi:hypothetical protein